MKKNILLGGFVLAMNLLASCTSSTFKLYGEITEAQDSTLYFEALTLKGIELLDSMKLDEKGEFKFTGKVSDSPEFFRLRLGRKIITVAVDSVQQISVNASATNMITDYQVQGSTTSEKIKELAVMQWKLQEELLSISANKFWTSDDKRENTKRSLEAYKKLVKQNYIFESPKSAYAYFAVFQAIGPYLVFDPHGDEEDIKTFGAVSTAWSLYYPNSLRTQNLHNIVIEGMKTVRKQKSRMQNLDPSKVVVSGIIDIELPSTTGEMVKLSSLAGKVVLLDFTQYALPVSPQRTLEMRQLYEKYAAQGFEIYQISLDENEHFWRTSSRTLPWLCLYDKEGAASANLQSYQVMSLPEYFLINKANELVSRSIDITDLEQEIKRLL